MKKNILFGLSVAVLFFPGLVWADAPRQVCGFVLGESIEKHKDKVNMDTAIPIRYLECIKEVEIKKSPAIKTGLIGFGTCTSAKPIVRIKIKYADNSKKFYDKLLKRFKAKFGEPTEWRGDPFHIFIAWKWSFTDKDNNQISLNLSHNTMDLEEKRGNAVKLAMWNLIKSEQRCFQEKYPAFREPKKTKGRKTKDRGPIDWEFLVPR